MSPSPPDHPDDGALSFDVSFEEQACVIHVSGDIDITTAEWLRTRLLQLADEGHVNQVLSFEGDVFLDSAGLGAIVSIRRRLQVLGGALVLACSNELVLRLLRLTSLDKVVAIHATAAEALEREFAG
ncbi:STAS domain-containing protein [Nocardioides sp. CER19]|uniref:STAS domain-containing protein n=1 Tax=Nocardioides sp. CER19 TaxID=3038538 RepID=UPI00244D3E1F|nr:STAS domain-containing protein [Nocardioides sp. CER19]MDH2415298.1 STAS domain-containing protein [Nocardioides sp. CER19]